MRITKIETTSKWKENLKHDFIIQDSDTLLVTLPGYGYESVAPLLYYTTNLAIEEGFDVLCIEYGYMKKQIDIQIGKELDILVKETKEAIDKALEHNHKNLILVGKSLGTFIINQLKQHYNNKKITYIYLTTVNASVPSICNNDTLMVFGTEDKHLSQDMVNCIKERNDLEVLELKGADHSLEFESTNRSIEAHLEVIKRCKEFLSC